MNRLYEGANRELMKDACIWEDLHSTSSKICRFRSLHLVHIKHKGIRFQISEVGPRPRHPHNKSRTFSCKTHWTPNILKIKLHNSKAMVQWIKRWSTVSLLQWHIQHQLTIEKNILMRFLVVRWKEYLDEILSCENLPPSCCPHKERNSLRGLGSPYGLPRKKHKGWALQFLTKRLHSELPITLLTSISSYHSPP